MGDWESSIDTAMFEERQRVGGDGYLELAATFLSYMGDELAILTEAVENDGLRDNPDRAAHLASRSHGLAGGAATFGLRGVQEAALQMERTLLQRHPSGIRASYLVLEDECRHAEDFLRGMIEPR